MVWLPDHIWEAQKASKGGGKGGGSGKGTCHRSVKGAEREGEWESISLSKKVLLSIRRVAEGKKPFKKHPEAFQEPILFLRRLVIFFSLTEALLPDPTPTPPNTPKRTRNGPETEANRAKRSRNGAKRSRKGPKSSVSGWDGRGVFGVGGWGVVREKENH